MYRLVYFHAGTRLGDLAFSNEIEGQTVQKRLAIASETDAMPRSHHLEVSIPPSLPGAGKFYAPFCIPRTLITGKYYIQANSE